MVHTFGIMFSLLFHFISFCVITLLLVSGDRFNITNGVQDYFKASQLQLLHSIEIVELKIASVDASIASRLDVIQYEQHQLLHEIHLANQSLTLLQSLSLVRKHCVQKYAPQFVTQSETRSKLKVCHHKAKHGLESLTSNAKVSVNSAKSFAINKFEEGLTACSERRDMKNDTALELCSINYVELATKTIGNYSKSALDYLEKSLFDASVILRNANRCTYQVTSDVLKSLGASLKDISNCQRDFVEESPLDVYHNKEKLDNLPKDKIEDEIDLNENAIQKESENYEENDDEGEQHFG